MNRKKANNKVMHFKFYHYFDQSKILMTFSSMSTFLGIFNLFGSW